VACPAERDGFREIATVLDVRSPRGLLAGGVSWGPIGFAIIVAFTTFPSTVYSCAGTRCFTAGCERRYDMTATRSSSAKPWNSMNGRSARPSAPIPFRSARASWPSV
jgi:hypothetical protein